VEQLSLLPAPNGCSPTSIRVESCDREGLGEALPHLRKGDVLIVGSMA